MLATPARYYHPRLLQLSLGRIAGGRALSQPTLVVAGEDDPSVPLRNGRILAARIPDSRLHVVTGGGHLFLLDEPESSAAAIRTFLDAS